MKTVTLVQYNLLHDIEISKNQKKHLEKAAHE